MAYRSVPMATCSRTSPFDENVLGCSPLIAVVQTTDFGDCGDPPHGAVGRWSAIRRVFAEAKVCAGPMVIADIGREEPSKVRSIDDDDVVETLASDRSDQPFDVRICHGLAGAEMTSAMPMPVTLRRNTSP